MLRSRRTSVLPLSNVALAVVTAQTVIMALAAGAVLNNTKSTLNDPVLDTRLRENGREEVVVLESDLMSYCIPSSQVLRRLVGCLWQWYIRTA